MLRFSFLVKIVSLRIIVEQTDNWANVFTGWMQQNNGTRILSIWTGLPVAFFPIQPRRHRLQASMGILEYLTFCFFCPTNPKTVSVPSSTFPIHILSWALLMKIVSSTGWNRNQLQMDHQYLWPFFNFSQFTSIPYSPQVFFTNLLSIPNSLSTISLFSVSWAILV